MESKVVNFPKEKSAKAPKTDAEHLAEIKKLQRALCRAIDAAHAAGLTVKMRVDAEDRWGHYQANKVRLIDPSIIRTVT